MNIQQQIMEKIQSMNGENKNNNYITIPNPDFVHRKEIEEAIKENGGYCCCALEKIQTLAVYVKILESKKIMVSVIAADTIRY